MLHRAKRTPGQFMMRLRTPNGIITSDQLRFYSDSVSKYGDELGVIDITTRSNIVSICTWLLYTELYSLQLTSSNDNKRHG